MEVGETAAVSDVVFVVGVDSKTRTTIAQDVTSAERNFAYPLTDLPPNRFKIYAGTDRDGDDRICDPGEWCGGNPSAIDANEMVLQEGAELTGVDFPVGELIFEATSPQYVMICGAGLG